VRNVTDRTSNPFDMRPPCDRFVPGYGDANADFHVIGDSPAHHGGAETGVPFTSASGRRLQEALREAGLLVTTGAQPRVDATFFSYLNMCVDEPSEDRYDELERFFDAELRAIAAHVLLPVGARPTSHVLDTYTARGWKTERDMDRLHATELQGSGWLVLPIKDPAEWTDDDEAALVEALETLRATDFRREADLGRFMPGGDPYHVR
jgi:uracil-DNA glycosylase